MAILEKWAEPKPVKLTIADFLRLDEAGAFSGHAKTELIDGTIVAMNAQYSLHSYIKGQLFRRLSDACDTVLPTHRVWTEVTVAIPPSDLPEPDILIANYEPSARSPVPVDTVALIVEVADTTLQYDLGKKARIYAAGGVPEYWVVDLAGRLLYQMWSPTGKAYEETSRVALGTIIRAVTIHGLSVETGGL